MKVYVGDEITSVLIEDCPDASVINYLDTQDRMVSAYKGHRDGDQEKYWHACWQYKEGGELMRSTISNLGISKDMGKPLVLFVKEW